jgi:DNA-binding XRE family transcriptional regulator
LTGYIISVIIWIEVGTMNKATETATVYSPSVPWSEVRNELLSDPATRAAYDALEAEDQLIRQLIDLRIKRGLSQSALAKRAGLQQPALARVESGKTASLKTLRRVADALGADVKVSIVPRQAKATGKGSRK